MNTTHNDFHAPNVNMETMLKENSNSNGLTKLIEGDRGLELSTKLGKTLYSIKEIQTQNAAKVELIEMKTNALVSLLNEQIKSSAKIQSYTFRKLKFAELFLGVAIIILFFTLYINKTTTPQPLNFVAPIRTISKEYISLKFVNLRANANKNAQKLLTISPNQRLDFIEQKSGWIKVKHTNFIKGISQAGWVWSEFVKPF
jgi:hypothetical protein